MSSVSRAKKRASAAMTDGKPKSATTRVNEGLGWVGSAAASPAAGRPAILAEAVEDVSRMTPDPLDRLVHAREAYFTGSLSPVSLTLAYLDWAFHLTNAPGRRLELAREAGLQMARMASPQHWTSPARGDHRFSDPAWSYPPFNLINQAFLLAEEWWRDATLGPPGVAKSHSNVVSFGARQILDVFSHLILCSPTPKSWQRPRRSRLEFC